MKKDSRKGEKCETKNRFQLEASVAQAVASNFGKKQNPIEKFSLLTAGDKKCNLMTI